MKRNRRAVSAPTSNWPLAVIFVLLGLVIIAAGVTSWQNGDLWRSGYVPRTGTFETSTTFYYIFVGLLSIVFGVLQLIRK